MMLAGPGVVFVVDGLFESWLSSFPVRCAWLAICFFYSAGAGLVLGGAVPRPYQTFDFSEFLLRGWGMFGSDPDPFETGF